LTKIKFGANLNVRLGMRARLICVSPINWRLRHHLNETTYERRHAMPLFHAVAWVDHHSAQVLQFDAEHVLAQKVQSHTHYTKQHASHVRTEHEFFGEVCDAMESIAQVLVTGPRKGIDDFRHYVEKHRPDTGKRIVAYEVSDHPSENQLVALARKFFDRRELMAGIPGKA
jgi:stalled ribosome rescue protein Dom34